MSIILNNDVVKVICLQLTAKEQFSLMRVSKQFQQCIEYSLSITKLLIIGRESVNCSDVQHLNFLPLMANDISPLFERKDNFDAKTWMTIFGNVINLCYNIQCLQLKNISIDNEFLKILGKILTKLNCLSLESCVVFIENNWPLVWRSSLKSLLIYRLDHKDVVGTDVWSEPKRLDFIATFTSLKHFTLQSDTHFRMKRNVELTLDKLPSSIKYLVLSRIPLFANIFIENLINLGKFSALRHLYIHTFRISKLFLLAIIDRLDLLSLGIHCYEIDWQVMSRMADKQQNLRQILILLSIFDNSLSEEREIKPLINVKKFECHQFYFRSTIEEYKSFLKLFPNIKTLHYSMTGVVCQESINSDFDDIVCQTCLKLTFETFFSQMKALRILYIKEDSIQAIIGVFYSNDINLRLLVIGKAHRFNTEDMEDYIVWQIKQLVTIFVEQSKKFPTKLFSLAIERECNFQKVLFPKNLYFYKLA